MFGQLTEKFHSIFSTLMGPKKLTADNIQDAVDEVRLALLEADVQYSVVKTIIKRMKEKAEGVELIKNVQPGQQFAKIGSSDSYCVVRRNRQTAWLYAEV